jgi:plasmid maintenance system antidote protein VapI
MAPPKFYKKLDYFEKLAYFILTEKPTIRALANFLGLNKWHVNNILKGRVSVGSKLKWSIDVKMEEYYHGKSKSPISENKRSAEYWFTTHSQAYFEKGIRDAVKKRNSGNSRNLSRYITQKAKRTRARIKKYAQAEEQRQESCRNRNRARLLSTLRSTYEGDQILEKRKR